MALVVAYGEFKQRYTMENIKADKKFKQNLTNKVQQKNTLLCYPCTFKHMTYSCMTYLFSYG